MSLTLPKVVVLTPVYNGAKFLREALISVQEQSYANLAHFVLDNASTDSTPDILAEFENCRVPLIVRRNETLLPIAQNWNRCLRLGAEGAEYFRVLCADDTMPTDGIEKMVLLAEKDPAIALIGCQRWTSDGIEEFNWDRARSVFDGREAARSCFLGDAGFPPPHLFYRRSVLDLRDPFFSEDLMAFDAEAAIMIMTTTGRKFGFINEPLGFTRRHASTVTQTFSSRVQSQYFDWLVVVDRHASAVLEPEELAEYKRAFKRHYIARLLAWRFRDGRREAFDWHIHSLKTIGQSPGAAEYVDALADHVLKKINVRPKWAGYPQG